MDFITFITSPGEAAPPAPLSAAIQALWHSQRGDWHAAHNAAQVQDDQQGDLLNARYRYQRANRSAVTGSLDEEWETIARALLG